MGMGLSWQQGPLGSDPVGRFLVDGGGLGEVPYADPLRRLMSAELGGETVVASEGATLLFEPNRYPLVLYESGFAPRWYLPEDDVRIGEISPVDHRTFCPYKGVPGQGVVSHGIDRDLTADSAGGLDY
jgi:hypothetical protein